MADWTNPVTWTTSMALSVARLNEQLRDNMLALKAMVDAHAENHADDGTDKLYYKRQAMWHIPGNLATGATQSATIVYRGPAGTIVRADAIVETAPANQQLLIDLNIGGTSIWKTNQSWRLAISAGSKSGTQTVFDTSAIADGDVLTVDLDQVGSGTTGADLTVVLQMKCPLETS